MSKLSIMQWQEILLFHFLFLGQRRIRNSPDPLWPKYFKRHCPVSTSHNLAERSVYTCNNQNCVIRTVKPVLKTQKNRRPAKKSEDYLIQGYSWLIKLLTYQQMLFQWWWECVLHRTPPTPHHGALHNFLSCDTQYWLLDLESWNLKQSRKKLHNGEQTIHGYTEIGNLSLSS